MSVTAIPGGAPLPLHEMFGHYAEVMRRAEAPGWNDELASAIFEYIEAFYNPRRRHSSIGNLNPVEFEARHTDTAVAA